MEKPTNLSWEKDDHGISTNSSSSMSPAGSAIHITVVVIYFIVILACLFGNSILIHIIRTRNFLKSGINYLILNQACADLIITLTMMKSMLSDELFQREWFSGDWGLVTCRLVVWLNFPSPFCSIWSLVAIAVDRYFAVSRPLHLSLISRHIRWVICVIWLWSFASAAGMISMAELWLVNGDNYYCVIDFSNVQLTAANITTMCILFTSNFLVPVLLMTVLYSIVCWRLWSRDIPGEGANQDQRHEQAINTAKKVTWMMIAVVVLFVLCWFPFQVFVGLNSIHKLKLPYVALKFIVCLANSYSAINPFLYLSLNSKFRKEFSIVMGKCFRKFCRCCKTSGQYNFSLSENITR